MKTTITQLRLIAFIEGISYIALLFIAMPMKYMYGIAEATKIVGMTHGVLFIIFIYLLLKAHMQYKWSFVWTVIAFISSIIPFGTFFIDKKLKSFE